MIYIDAGYYYGKTLERYQESGLVDDSWAIYAFEPSTDLEIPTFVSRKAVWVKGGTVTFKVNHDRNDASSIKGTSGMGSFEEIEADCFDFSKFVGELPDVYTICSLDIEGGEFRVLRKMLKDDTITKIDLLDVEFHHRLMLKEDDKTAQEILTAVLDKGVAVRLKVPLI